jgi:peptide/nickel transport system permease protein
MRLRAAECVAALVVALWVLAACLAPLLLGRNGYHLNLHAVLQPPSPAHILGTDDLGRDVFARTLLGARPVLALAAPATGLALLLGGFLGLAAGFFGGLLDAVLGRIFEAMLAVPLILMALLALSALGPSPVTATVVIGVVFTPLIARTVRAAVLRERGLDYVAAARLRGDGALRIMLVEILPNVRGVLAAEGTVRLAYAIFTGASLSFLGFGAAPPSPDWGRTIADTYGLLAGGFWWPAIAAAGAIASLVISVQVLAQAMQREAA